HAHAGARESSAGLTRCWYYDCRAGSALSKIICSIVRRLFRTEQRKARDRPIVPAIKGAVVAPWEQVEDTMYLNQTNAAEGLELSDAELARVAGGELPDAVKFFIAALASPAPYDPKNPDYSGYGHMIGTCPK